LTPGGPENNATEQKQWLKDHTDVLEVNAGDAKPLWPMFPTGQAQSGGEDPRHPGVKFDRDY